MQIAMIGAGNVGRTLGAGWVRTGHNVTFGVRDPSATKYQALVQQLGPSAQVTTVAQAAATAPLVVLATPWSATESALREAGDLGGKIVVDCTNPLRPDLSGLTHGYEDSGGEQVARWSPGARVCKAFNSTGFNIMEQPELEGHRAVMCVCGDDAEAKRQVLDLTSELGFEAIDAGGLSNARLLEPLALLWITLAYQCGLGRDFAFGLLRRERS
jgi:predicted dinucleotide-binding enzyme